MPEDEQKDPTTVPSARRNGHGAQSISSFVGASQPSSKDSRVCWFHYPCRSAHRHTSRPTTCRCVNDVSHREGHAVPTVRQRTGRSPRHESTSSAGSCICALVFGKTASWYHLPCEKVRAAHRPPLDQPRRMHLRRNCCTQNVERPPQTGVRSTHPRWSQNHENCLDDLVSRRPGLYCALSGVAGA